MTAKAPMINRSVNWPRKKMLILLRVSSQVRLRFWAKSEVDGIGQVFWWTKEIPRPTGERQTNFILEPGKEHLYEVPFHAESELAGVRLDLVQPIRDNEFPPV